MELLLTHGYFLEEDEKEQRIMKPYAPLGLLYLSSHLRSRGVAVEIYDSTFGSRQELYGILATETPAVLGISVNLMTRASVLGIIAQARACGWRIVLGGPEPANYAVEYLDSGADVVVDGEGEIALEQLLPLLRSGTFPRVYGPVALIPSLDSQPWPDRERIDIPRYLRAWRERHGAGSISVITSRGCPYHCRWCSHSVFGKTHRRRSAASVADEVEWLLRRYSPEMLWMADDVFTIHHGWLAEYAAELKRRGIRIPFECITRADRLNERAAGLLAELGCFRVWIGSESGSQRILDRMQRGVRVEQVQNAVELCKRQGIQTGMFLMWGYEGEEIGDIEATVQHVKLTRPDVFLTTVSYPIKGTPYFEETSPRLIGINGWPQSTDRDLRIRGRHSRRYYEFADMLLKSEVALANARDTESAELQQRVRAARQGLSETAAEVEA